MGLVRAGNSNVKYTNASFDKAMGMFFVDDRDGHNKRALAGIRDHLGYENTDGFSPETAKAIRGAAIEAGVDLAGSAVGEFQGVQVYDKDNQRYFKIRLKTPGEDGEKDEVLTLSYSVSATHEGNNRHVTGAVIALDKAKVGEVITVSSYASLQHDADGNPRLNKDGKEVYGYATNVYEGERQEGDKPIPTAGDPRWKFKELLAEKRAALEGAGLDEKQVNEAVGKMAVAKLMEYAKALEAKFPIAKAAAHSASSAAPAADEDPVMPADKAPAAASAPSESAPNFDEDF